MALPALAAPAVSLVGQGIGALSQGRQNRKSRRFAREMYNRSWEDQTSFSREMYQQQKQDQIAFWNMQNQYNSPSAEMNRIKEAGLNPALMYGSGAQANRAGDIGKPSVESARGDVKPGQFNPVRFDGNSAMLAYNQTRIADKQMELLEAEKLAKQAAAFKDTQSGKQSEFDLGLKEDTRAFLFEKIQAEATSAEAKAAIDKMNVQVQFEMFQSGRTLKGAIADVVYKQLRNQNLKAQRNHINQAINNLVSENELKQMEIKLRKHTGQTYGSGAILAPVIRAIYHSILNAGEAFGKGINLNPYGSFVDEINK